MIKVYHIHTLHGIIRLTIDNPY